MPAAQVDDRVIGDGRPGPVTRQLMDLHARFIADVTAGRG